jgi:hypothetical protein
LEVIMNRMKYPIAGLIALMCQPVFAQEQEPIIYPAKGQSDAQQQKDKGECGTWATQNTGVDPLAIAQAQTSQSEASAPRGERVKGAARGAAAGAAIGAIAGDAGKGAGVGAATGTVAAGSRQRRKGRAGDAAAAQDKQNAKDALATYARAYHACLEGRGYTVK